jgi:hypothetical protein
MTELGLVLIVLMMLACPIVMGPMMLMMWRGMRHRDGRDSVTREPDARA